MKSKIKPLFFSFFCFVVFCSPVFAGGGGGGSSNNSSPSYYTYDDLLEIAKENKDNFFYRRGQYSDGIIPERTIYSNAVQTTTLKNTYKAAVTPTIKIKKLTKQAYLQNRKAEPTTTLKTTYLGDTVEVHLSDLFALPGDLIFVRSHTAAGKILTTTVLSAWTHVALIWSKNQNTVLESMPEWGVRVNYISESWKNVVAYGTKSLNRVKYFSSAQEDSQGKVVSYTGSKEAYNAMFAAERNYKNKPYFPNMDKDKNSKTGFFQRWSDKNNKESMYCSKLIYWTYKDYDWTINLDSNNTRVRIQSLADSNSWSNTWGGTWIGISPDDIWDSCEMTKAWDLYAPSNLYADIPGINSDLTAASKK